MWKAIKQLFSGIGCAIEEWYLGLRYPIAELRLEQLVDQRLYKIEVWLQKESAEHLKEIVESECLFKDPAKHARLSGRRAAFHDTLIFIQRTKSRPLS